MGTIYKSALIHSCDTEPIVTPEAALKVGSKYVKLKEDPKEISTIPLDGTGEYFSFAPRCNCPYVRNEDFLGEEPWMKVGMAGITYRCRKYVSLDEAEQQLKVGNVKVVWTLNPRKKVMQAYTERVAEEEKYLNGEFHKTGRTLTIYHFWKRQQPRVPRVDLITAKDIERAYVDETKQSIAFIEDIHELLMKNRMDLFDPEVAKKLKRLYRGHTADRKTLEKLANEIKHKGFKDDPTQGRLLFPFFPDERTSAKGRRGDDKVKDGVDYVENRTPGILPANVNNFHGPDKGYGPDV